MYCQWLLAVSVITRQRLDDQGLNTIASVLEQTPGKVDPTVKTICT